MQLSTDVLAPPEGRARVLPVVYEELRRLARAWLARELAG